MDELNINTGFIVTRNEEEKIQTESGIIEVIPVWRFMLNIDKNT